MSKTDLHILMLEDDPLDAELNKEQLFLLKDYNCIVNLVVEKEKYIHAIENSTPDLILCDYNLPGYNGLDALRDLRIRNKLIPFIFVTGTMQEEVAAAAISAGAWEYVVKDRLFRLPLAVQSVLNLKQEKELAAKAEEQIRRLLMAVEQTSAQIIVTDTSGKIEYVNKKFTEITGFSQEEVMGTDANIISQNDKNKDGFAAIIEKLNKKEVYKGEILSRRKDGSTFWELVSASPIIDSEKKLSNFVIVKEDITHRKKIEEELILAKEKAERSDKLKDAFLQNMSHEIRTPMNAIVGFSSLLNSEKDLDENTIKSFTELIINNSNQLLSIVSDILTMASIQTGEETLNIGPVDLSEILTNLYNTSIPEAANKNIVLSYSKHLLENELFILTDQTKLTKILTNLVNNAIKYTEKGSVEIDYTISDALITFSIKDTGIGISKEDQETIFERFRQALPEIHVNYGGAGLGLSISKSFAEMLGGTIRIESELNKGSTFYLRLPFSQVQTKNQPDQEINTEIPSQPITIIVAEDEKDNYLLIKSILQGDTIRLHHASNGLEAVKLCKDIPDADLVLMDIKMPVMNGIAAFNAIKEFRKNLPIIAQTAYAHETERKQLLKIGFDDYLAKPLNQEVLFKKIYQIIR